MRYLDITQKNAHNLIPEKGEKETPEFLGSSDFIHSAV
jgi:hypothetical protein